MTGGLRKIADATRPCLSSEHNPPTHIVLEPGTYEYTCPACGAKTVFVVNGVWFGAETRSLDWVTNEMPTEVEVARG